MAATENAKLIQAQLKENNNEDILIVDCDTYDTDIILLDSPKNVMPKPITQSQKSKKKSIKTKSKRKVKLNNIGDTHSLTITQEVKVHKPDVHCIINIDTNICKLKKSKFKRSNRSNKKQKVVTEKIVPHCLRKTCKSSILSKTEQISKSKRVIKDTRSRRHRPHTIVYPENNCKTHKFEDKQNLLSPISLSPLPNDVNKATSISYEDISDNDFSDSDKLEKLIKRTKDRERSQRIQQKCHNQFVPIEPASIIFDSLISVTSTPNNIEDRSNSVEYDMDLSIHSIPTVILEPDLNNEPYSPTESLSDFFNSETRSEKIYDDNKSLDSEVYKLKGENLVYPTKMRIYSPTDTFNRLFSTEILDISMKIKQENCVKTESKIKDENRKDTRKKHEEVTEIKKEILPPILGMTLYSNTNSIKDDSSWLNDCEMAQNGIKDEVMDDSGIGNENVRYDLQKNCKTSHYYSTDIKIESKD